MHDTKELIENIPGDVAAAIEAGRDIGELSLQTFNDVPIVISREPMEIQKLTGLMDHPPRFNTTMTVNDADSFIQYCRRFGDDNSIIRCETLPGNVTGFLNYHSKDKPSHNDHRVILQIEITDEWKAWSRKNGVQMTQEEFAEHIDDNTDDITSPPAAEMLEVAQSLSGNINVSFKHGQRLSDGSIQMQYQEEINGQAGHKGQLHIPSEFVLGIAPFYGAELYRVDVKFRYRIRDGRLHMSYHMHRPKKVFEHAIKETMKKIQEQLPNIAILFG